MTFNMFYTKNNFDMILKIILTSETRIIKQLSLINKLNLDFECIILLYIANHLFIYLCRNDLNITKNNKMESDYIEIVTPNIIYCQQN